MDDCDELIPRMARFIKGVVDSERSPSEHLQRDPLTEQES